MLQSTAFAAMAVTAAVLFASPAVADGKRRTEAFVASRNLHSSVFSGNETRLAQFGWMARPCSGPLPDVHVVEKPSKGSVRFEKVATTVTASRSAVQKKCFGKPVDMLAMYYRAGADSAGHDKVVVDVDTKLGHVIRYVVVIDIRAVAHPEAVQNTPTQRHVDRVVLRGNEMRIAAPNYLNADCSSGPLPDLRIISAPKNGTYRTEETQIAADRPAGNSRVGCNGKPVKAVAIYYKPKDDFSGIDDMVVDVDFRNGTVRRYNYAITVR